MPHFHVEELNQIVTEFATKYHQSMLDEIHLMTLIEDPDKSIKNEEVCRLKAEELKKKHLVHDIF